MGGERRDVRPWNGSSGPGRPETKGSYRDIDLLPVVEEALRKTAWTPGLKRAGLKYQSIYHTRCTFTTLMLSAGENMGWVQQMMEHASLKMIQERYYRFIPNLTHTDNSFSQFTPNSAPIS